MRIEGKSISGEQAADLFANGTVTKEVSSGGMNAKWVEGSGGGSGCILVQGLTDQVLHLEIVVTQTR